MGTDTDRHFIAHMMWDEVARHIANGAAAILPIGAAAKQHGFHLPLDTDRIQAECLASQARRADRRADLADAQLRILSGLRGLCRQRSLTAATFEAVVHEIATDIIGNGCRKLLVLNTGISTLAPVERALARLDAGKVMHLRIHEGPRYRRAAERSRRAEPWQPRRRTRDLADAGAGAAFGRHGARRTEPCDRR